MAGQEQGLWLLINETDMKMAIKVILIEYITSFHPRIQLDGPRRFPTFNSGNHKKLYGLVKLLTKDNLSCF